MQALRLLLVLVSTLALGGCELIGDIFQAGFVVGIILMVLIIGAILFVVRKLKR